MSKVSERVLVNDEQGVVVIDAAPIMSWAVGKTRAEIRNWVAKKKGMVKFVCAM